MIRTSPRAALLVALVTIAIVAAACGSGASTQAPASAPTAAPTEAASPAASSADGEGGTGDAVTIKDFAFGPASLEVAVGSTVTWTNEDSASHTATADDGSFDSSSLATGSIFSHTFAAAWTFAYHCSIHSSMKATIVVQ